MTCTRGCPCRVERVRNVPATYKPYQPAELAAFQRKFCWGSRSVDLELVKNSRIGLDTWLAGDSRARNYRCLHPPIWGFLLRQIYQEKSETKLNVIYILSLTRVLCFSSNFLCLKTFGWISIEFQFPLMTAKYSPKNLNRLFLSGLFL